MEATQTQQTEKLIEEMLGFLDSSTDEEDEESNDEEPEDDNDEDEEEEDAYESARDEQTEANNDKEMHKPKQKRPKISIAKELKKIKNSFPIWNTREIAPTAKRLVDPIWRQYGNATKYEQAAYENDWNSKLESNCRRSSNSYVQEVNRAIYGDTNGHPANGSADYFQAAQNYAIYGKDFLDFPENLTPLLGEKSPTAPVVEPSNVPYMGATPNVNACYGNGLYPTPTAPAPESSGVNFANFGKQLAAAGASTAAYYQMCNGLQPTLRPTAASAGAGGSTAYGMFLGNKVTYVAAAPPNAPPPLVYNQHSSTTTNFISNSLANAALASSPAILYSNPMLTTTTQQYLNTFFKETQYLSGGTSQGAVAGTTTGIYERLVYAQMLQQQIYHQTQQQAAAVAAMFQHKQRPRSNGVGPTANAGAPGGVGVGNSGGVSPAGVGLAASLNLCGRQAAMASASSSELLTKNIAAAAAAAASVPLTNGAEELVVAAATAD